MRRQPPVSVPNDDDPLLLDRQVCFPLYAATNLLQRAYRPVLATLGLTYPQYLVMLVLWESATQSVGALGERLHLDSGTLTPLLKRMEQAGFVRRQRDPQDERRVLVHLTEAGHMLKAEAATVPATLAQGLNLQPAEVEALRSRVQALVALLSSRLDPN